MKQDFNLPRWQFWLALLGTPVLWLVHFLLVYMYSEFACAYGPLSTLDRAVLLIGGLLFALGTLVITVFTYRAKGRAKEENTGLFTIGFLMGLLFTFVLLVESLSVFFIESCA
jgi:hypothetical protein